MKLSALKPNPKNPRFIRDDKFKKLVEGLKEFPEMMKLRPMVVDDENIILGGNMRFKALQELKFKEIPDEWVLKASALTEDQKRRFIIADNLPFGQWDFEALANDWDMDELLNWGFSEEELTGGIASLPPGESEGEDDAPEIGSEAITKPGDIYDLGGHRLICGNSMLIDDIDKLMAGNKAAICITDPPYGVSYADKNSFLNSVDKRDRIQKEIENDHLNEEDIQQLWKLVFSNVTTILAETNAYYIFGPQIQGMMMMMMMMMEAGLPYRHVLIWVKNNHVLGRCDYHYKHEPIFFGWTTKHKFHGKGEFNTSVWTVDKPLKNDLHPTMKPVALMENMLLDSSQINGICFEPFAGSGSTLIACEKTKRRCFAMEIDPKYCDVIVRRYIKFCKENNREYSVKRNGEECHDFLYSEP